MARHATAPISGPIVTTISLPAPLSELINSGHLRYLRYTGVVISGCMFVQRPLFGSGPLTGIADNSRIFFTVSGAIGKITFIGKRQGTEIEGTYTVERSGSPDQHGNFTLQLAKTEGLPSNFNPANCPTDAEIHK
jgi:hypothetical protein